MSALLAVVSGSGLVNLLVWIIVVGIIFWLATWVIKAIPVPEPFAQVLRVVLIIAAFIFLANALLTLVGHPIIAW